MSKEIKMVEQHWLLSVAIHKAKNISRIQCLPKGSDPKEHWCGILVGEIERLVDEVAALREALPLEEDECKALSHLSLRNKQLEEKLENVWGALYGKGFEISGFHLNGDLEPMDNFFDNNDWDF